MKTFLIPSLIAFALYFQTNICKSEDLSKILGFSMSVKSRCPNSNYYWAEITLENKSSHTIGYWESVNDYGGVIFFSRVGIVVVPNLAYYFYIKYSKIVNEQIIFQAKVLIPPHRKIKKSVLLYVYNKKLLLKNTKDLRPFFIFYDANINDDRDSPRGSVLSDNIVRFDW